MNKIRTHKIKNSNHGKNKTISDIETDISIMEKKFKDFGNKTQNLHKAFEILKSYMTKSELKDIEITKKIFSNIIVLIHYFYEHICNDLLYWWNRKYHVEYYISNIFAKYKKYSLVQLNVNDENGNADVFIDNKNFQLVILGSKTYSQQLVDVNKFISSSYTFQNDFTEWWKYLLEVTIESILKKTNTNSENILIYFPTHNSLNKKEINYFEKFYQLHSESESVWKSNSFKKNRKKFVSTLRNFMLNNNIDKNIFIVLSTNRILEILAPNIENIINLINTKEDIEKWIKTKNKIFINDIKKIRFNQSEFYKNKKIQNIIDNDNKLWEKMIWLNNSPFETEIEGEIPPEEKNYFENISLIELLDNILNLYDSYDEESKRNFSLVNNSLFAFLLNKSGNLIKQNPEGTEITYDDDVETFFNFINHFLYRYIWFSKEYKVKFNNIDKNELEKLLLLFFICIHTSLRELYKVDEKYKDFFKKYKWTNISELIRHSEFNYLGSKLECSILFLEYLVQKIQYEIQLRLKDILNNYDSEENLTNCILKQEIFFKQTIIIEKNARMKLKEAKNCSNFLHHHQKMDFNEVVNNNQFLSKNEKDLVKKIRNSIKTLDKSISIEELNEAILLLEKF